MIWKCKRCEFVVIGRKDETFLRWNVLMAYYSSSLPPVRVNIQRTVPSHRGGLYNHGQQIQAGELL